MRFSSFSNEWTTSLLKDSASFYKGTGISKEELSEESWSFDKDEIDTDYKGATNALKAIKEIALYFDKNDASQIAMHRLFHPLGLQLGSEKEKEYKAMVFSELGIKVNENYEIQI